jgi:hypothetical protein
MAQQEVVHFKASNPYQFTDRVDQSVAMLTDFRIRRAREAAFALKDYGEELSSGLEHATDENPSEKTDVQDLFRDFAAFASAVQLATESHEGFVISAPEIKDRLRTSVFETLGIAAKISDKLRNQLATLDLPPGDPRSEFVNMAMPRMVFFSQRFHNAARATLAPADSHAQKRETLQV